MKCLNVKGWYGWYTVLKDKKLAKKLKTSDYEFMYITRGIIRLSPDSALGFSLMTNEINTKKYKKLFRHIKSYVKARKDLT